MMSCRFSWAIALLASSLAFVSAQSDDSLACPTGYELQKRKVLKTANTPRCLPNIRDILSARWDEYEAAWNSSDYQAMEDFYAEDSVFVPAGVDIRRGPDGFAEFIEDLITTYNWLNASYTIQDMIYVTDELVFTIDTFIWERNGTNPLRGKDVILWKLIDGIYYIYYGVANLESYVNRIVGEFNAGVLGEYVGFPSHVTVEDMVYFTDDLVLALNLIEATDYSTGIGAAYQLVLWSREEGILKAAFHTLNIVARPRPPKKTTA